MKKLPVAVSIARRAENKKNIQCVCFDSDQRERRTKETFIKANL